MARRSLAVAALLAGLQAASGSGDALQVYTATLTRLDGGGAAVDGADFAGEVAVFVTAAGLTGAGRVQGLEPDLADAANNGTDCTAKNGCGAHVHSGTACTDAATQGGHYYEGSTDPWATVGYGSTDAQGRASFGFAIADGARSLAGKPFVVHNNAGGRVACGLLKEAASDVRHASLAQLSGSGVDGSVTVWTSSRGYVFGAGVAEHLEANLTDAAHGGTDCTAKNGCGAHVHSGTACTDAATQGGHYYEGSTDPWATIGYGSTSAEGAASFVFAADAGAGAVDVTGKPFIVHNNAGGRVACGLLGAVATGGDAGLVVSRAARGGLGPAGAWALALTLAAAARLGAR